MKSCWAKSLGECDGNLSREHIVSNTLLDQSIKVQGFSWCKDEPKEIGAESLVSKILCEKHNNELSEFDSEANKFVQILKTMDNKNKKFKKFGFRKSDIPVLHHLDGLKLERWFCKTIINIVQCQNENIRTRFEDSLKYLFLGESFSEPSGLYVGHSIGMNIDTNDFLSLSPLYFVKEKDERELAGGVFVFKGFRFLISLPCSNKELLINRILNQGLNIHLRKEIRDLEWMWHLKALLYNDKIGKKKHIFHKIKINWE